MSAELEKYLKEQTESLLIPTIQEFIKIENQSRAFDPKWETNGLNEKVCEVAGSPVKAPFERLTYAQAMRMYGSDKPDLRLPPFHVLDGELPPSPAFADLKFPPVAIHVPKVGSLSRKERDDWKAYGTERGLRVYDDMKRLDPIVVDMARKATGATEDDLLILAGWPGEPSGQRPEETFFQACGQLRLAIGQKYADRHKLLDPKVFRFL